MVTETSGRSESSDARSRPRLAGRALRSASAASALPWQVAFPGQPIDVTQLLRAATPATTAAVRRASLRFPAVGLLVTVAVDLLVGQLLGGGGPWLLARSALAAVVGAAGLVVGRSAGTLRVLTGGLSIVLAGVQLVALSRAPLGSNELIAVVSITSSMLCAVTSAWHALRS